MNAPTRRKVVVIAIGVIVAILVVYGFLPKPVPVDAVRAVRGPLQVTIEEEARTRVKDRYVISAPVTGHLRRIRFEAGDLVNKGEMLAELDPVGSAALDPRSRAEAEAAVAAARAALNAARERAEAARAEAAYAKERAERMQRLFDQGMIAQDERDQAAAEAKRAEALALSAQAAATAAGADLERAESVLRYSASIPGRTSGTTVSITAPVKGRVLRVHRESEGVVAVGEPLLELGNPNNLEVRAEVLSSDAVKIDAGDSVVFERWGGEADLLGRVRVVEPGGFTKVSSLGVEEQRVLVIADFTSPRPLWEPLGDGYRLEARFIIWQGEQVLQVPSSALFQRAGAWQLFAVEEGRAVARKVKVGHRSGLAAEVLSGIEEGAIVIVNPDDAIQEGVKVEPRL